MNKGTVIVLIICALIAGLFLGKKSVNPPNYIFAPKAFYDSGGVYVSGTLTGDGVGYKDNTIAISCSKEKMTCLITSIQGISKTGCQLGRLDAPLETSVVKWDDYVITATDENPYDTFSCVKTTINIDRKSQIVEWIQEPINQSSLSCKDYSDTKIYKWTIEDPEWNKDFKSGIKNE